MQLDLKRLPTGTYRSQQHRFVTGAGRGMAGVVLYGDRGLYYSFQMKDARSLLLAAFALVLAGALPTLSFAASADAPCTCRNRDGTRYELGQMVCIDVGSGAYLARCERNLNVTTWQKLQDGCPQAKLSQAKLPLLH